MAAASFVIEVWEGVLTIRTGADVIGILNVARDRFATVKEGVLTLLLLVSAQGTLNAAPIRGAQDQEGVPIPTTTIDFAEMIVNAETVMIIATKTGTAASEQQVKAARKGLIVEMDKEVSGCAVRGVVNLARYLRWP